MLDFIQIPMPLLITFGIFAVFVCFVCFTMSYLRYYYNKYEPVYTKTSSGEFEKNHIASRFCKIIMSNTITDQCLTDIENIGLWMLASNIISEWPHNSLMSVDELQSKLSDILVYQLDVEQYEKMKVNLIKLELAMNSNLLKSKIPTPPYLRASTYAVWVTRVLSTMNKS